MLAGSWVEQSLDLSPGWHVSSGSLLQSRSRIAESRLASWVTANSPLSLTAGAPGLQVLRTLQLSVVPDSRCARPPGSQAFVHLSGPLADDALISCFLALYTLTACFYCGAGSFPL